MERYLMYLRKSRMDTDFDEISVEETLNRHRRILESFCKERRLNVVDVLEEVVSGESLSSRPKMLRLLELVNTGMYAGVICNGVQREHNKKLNNGLPILHKVPPKRDYGRYFCIMAEKGGTSHGGLTEKLSPFFHAKKQEVNAYGR